MKQFNNRIVVSAPCKIHLLGEHAVVYGKPALLATVDLRVKVNVSPRHSGTPRGIFDFSRIDSGVALLPRMTDIFEPILKKKFSLKKISPYSFKISSDIPIGSGLGSSAAISVAYFGAMLLFLGKPWDLETINALAYTAEKAFHGNPSGGDNSAVCYGGLVLYQKKNDKKIIKPLDFTIPQLLTKNFVLINTGKPKETTKKMVAFIKKRYDENPQAIQSILDSQEKLTEELVDVVRNGNEKRFVQIIKAGEHNLEKLGVVSPQVTSMIRIIESKGGAAKICGGGGIKNGTGVLLTYHKNPTILENIAKAHNLSFFKAAIGVEGVRQE